MGQYFRIVNLIKKQYIDLDRLGEGIKFSALGSGLNGIILGRLLASPGQWDAPGILKRYGDPDKDDVYVGLWAGDRIVIPGDYDKPRNYSLSSSADQTEDNLYFHVTDNPEYENITDKVIEWLAKEEWTAEMLAKNAANDQELLQKLSDLVLINNNEIMKNSLEIVIGSNWIEKLK